MCDVCRRTPCAAGCPNNDDEPLFYCNKCDEAIFPGAVYYEICGEIFCEDCVHDGRKSASRDVTYYNSGAPVISYGDKWED